MARQNPLKYRSFADLPRVVAETGHGGVYIENLPSVKRRQLDLEKARNWLNERLRHQDLEIGAKALGAGMWGEAYPMCTLRGEPKGVAKLTGDISEAAMAQRILDLPKRNVALPHIYAVFKLPNNVWFIWREDLAPLMKILSSRGIEALTDGWSRARIAQLSHTTATRILQFYRNLDELGISLPHTAEGKAKPGRWEFFDIHEANLRSRGTDIVISDLGASTGEDTLIPVAMNPVRVR